jgi:hypothetical protein
MTEHKADETTAIDDELLAEIRDQASVLSALDTAENVALDLHERPFSPETRQRALEWLQSDAYKNARHRIHAVQGAPHHEAE